jgi:hypothetical protein
VTAAHAAGPRRSRPPDRARRTPKWPPLRPRPGRRPLAVVERLCRHVDLRSDVDGDRFKAPELYLALWRPFAADDDPDEEEGFFFQSVLLARPGYDDTPAEAAARSAAGQQAGY